MQHSVRTVFTSARIAPNNQVGVSCDDAREFQSSGKQQKQLASIEEVREPQTDEKPMKGMRAAWPSNMDNN